MADTEEPQFNTLAERIAALNKQKSFANAQSPSPSPGPGPVRKRPPPPPPPVRPTIEEQSSNPSSPLEKSVNATTHSAKRPRWCSTSPASAPKPHPDRTPDGQKEFWFFREVAEFYDIYVVSRQTSFVTYDPASLPKLPPSRREKESAAKEIARPNRALPSPQPPRAIEPATLARPSLPPRLPSRPVKSQADATPEPQPAPQTRKIPPRPSTNGKSKGPVILGFSNKEKPQDSQSALPARPPIPGRPQSEDEPPPVPLASRPSMAQIEAFETKALTAAGSVNGCLICRDWSAPDAIAAQYPRQSLPRNDPIGYLAQVLCGPLPSYTDKARAIFTWFHYNINYDTDAFFNKTIKHMTAEDTVLAGKAVCAGYAETYKAIANRAGLECVVVTGHGKGFGYTPLKKGERPPPAKPDGHAWNAVRIDGGDWKLLDACWGAGHVDGQNYVAKFTPSQFTYANEHFGLRHFPKDSRHQFRADGVPVTWEYYYTGDIDGEPPTICGTTSEEGISEPSIQPKQRHISIDSGEIVRFQYSKICEHWTKEKCGGQERLVLLSLPRGEGQRDEMIPLETNGFWYWLDVNARDLGPRGKSVRLLVLTSFDGREDATGVTGKEFLAKVGRCAMGWSYLVEWVLI
ncbi:kyphoscoliosis peptidase [Fusarium sporotrichioides]|uniref:Kyphoscoliosis peptidase n=1 Tax=Fusarium sporotrichioides TaxID=5514 RepID=A0A395SS11_FUSSP|nr:kyphoscoliosis peptidase [Fusarium sporotrichioides]